MGTMLTILDVLTGRSGGAFAEAVCVKIALMAQPFRIGVIRLTMEPLKDARVGTRHGQGRHGHDLKRRLSLVAKARDGGSLVTVVSGLIAKATGA